MGTCLLEPAYTGDLTAFALKNSSQPFTTTDDALDDVWGIPTDWLFNEKFYYQENGSRVLIRPLILTATIRMVASLSCVTCGRM